MDDASDGLETCKSQSDDSVTPTWYIQENRARIFSDQCKQMAVMIFVYLFLVAAVGFYFICPNCIFGILGLSLLLCPFYHQFNLTLWIAIVLLTFSGWTITVGKFRLSWETN